VATRPTQTSRIGSRGATAATTRMTDRISAWASNHGRVARESVAELMAAWISSLMTWLVIGIALALPTLLFLLLDNVGDISGDWRGKPKVSVYLVETVTTAEGLELTTAIGERADVETARFISADEALAQFQSFSGFGDVLDSLDANPLPPLIEVVPTATEPGALRLLATNLEGQPRVDRVSVDLEWVERLHALLSLGERFVLALGVFLGLGVLLSIGNTIRLAIENRRAEIEVVKLVGGTDSFVRRPFLYLGFWYGFGGALAAWVMVQASLVFLSGPVDRLLRSYENTFELAGMGAATTLVLVASGALLGVLGAAMAVRRHLHLIEPQ